MKKTDYIILAATLLYSWLFYDQLPGVNFLVFNIAALVLLVIHRADVIRTLNWWVGAAGALFSAACIAWHGNLLSVTANLISLAFVAGLTVNSRSSVLVGVFSYMASLATSWYRVILNRFKPAAYKPAEAEAEGEPNQTKEAEKKEKTGGFTRVLIYGLPVVIAMLFVILYRQGNVLFDHFAAMINFDFISVSWVFFTIGGWFLMFAFYCMLRWKGLHNLDVNQAGNISETVLTRKDFWNQLLTVAQENTSGTMLLLLLNAMILIVNVLDINFLFLGNALPKGVNHSAMVHDGVNALITSIILAVLVILFHFRGRLNFFEKNNTIKLLACLWILQNMFMVFSTGYRNYLYVSADGMTAKRIGVYYYLGLCIIGLAFTCYKVLRRQTNWQLVREVSLAFYIALVISCVYNWEAYITDYNYVFQTKHRKEVNGGYFLSLNTVYLNELADLRYKHTTDSTLDPVWQRIDQKTYELLHDRETHGWQSWNADDLAAYNQITELADKQKFNSFYLADTEKNYNLAVLARLHPKKLFLIKTNLDSLTGIEALQSVKSLYISGNYIHTLDGIQKLTGLEELTIDEKGISDYRPISFLTNLKKVSFYGCSTDKIDFLRSSLPHTQILFENKPIDTYIPPAIEVPANH